MKLRNWLLLHVKQYNNCWGRTCVIRKCIYTYILLVDDLPSTNNFWKTNEQTKVIQEVVSPELSKLNHAVMNKNQGNQMQFSLKKWLEKKENEFIIYHRLIGTNQWIVLENGVIDLSIPSGIFHLFQNFYHATEKKQLR